MHRDVAQDQQGPGLSWPTVERLERLQGRLPCVPGLFPVGEPVRDPASDDIEPTALRAQRLAERLPAGLDLRRGGCDVPAVLERGGHLSMNPSESLGLLGRGGAPPPAVRAPRRAPNPPLEWPGDLHRPRSVPP